MRSLQVYRALDQVPNRFTLCHTVSQSVRRIHVNGNPFDGTLTAVLDGIGSGAFHGRLITLPSRDHKALLAA
ncbi:DNA-directed RNA polymerase subunit omega [Terriglobus albidus]|uniref:DNA-directed RNA polymerase subunit omega n=1 Tax=Terriglobus albidus TaxID=1592106 RepID=A0A5B9EBB6_9BACT|nr:DNA-directed RNA polymerase subunit omega [Terriglobus albidus]QEE27980.1 DNA-directed RNA polymerase subunit omega [Terriglobus albidus]